MEDQKQQQQNEQIGKYKKAIEYFKNKEYENASVLFKEIKEKNILPQSFDLQMNILICDFYSRNCSNHTKLLEELNSILKSLDSSKINTQSTQDSPALISQSNNPTSPNNSKENSNGSNFDLNHSSSSPSSSSYTPPTSTTASTSTITPVPISSGTSSTSTTNLHNILQQQQNQSDMIENDQAIILYNQSVIYFHIKQYGSSYKILDSIYQSILSLDDYLAIRVCFLLVNVSIEAQLYDKGEAVLSFLEKSFDHFFYLSTSTSSSSNESYDYQHTQMSPDEFKFLIHFYKSKIYLLSNSHYLAKSEIEESIKCSLKIDYLPLLGSCHLLNANYYSIELDTDNTIKNLLLSSSNSENNSGTNNKPISFGSDLVIEPITPRIFYNNIGSFHFNMDNKVLANYYFSRSLKESSIEINGGGNSFSRNLDKRTEVFFNTGIILMAMGKYDLAFSCLQESCILLKCNPLVWLRLAECCIFAHISKLKDSSRDQNSLGDDESTDDDINKENEISDETKDDSTKPNSINNSSGGDSSRDLNKSKSVSTKNKNKNKDKEIKENDEKENENRNELDQNININVDNNSTSGGANNNNNTDNSLDNNSNNIDNSNNTENNIDDENNNSVNFELIFGNIKILNNDTVLLPTVNGLHQGLQIEDSGVQSTLTNSGDEVEDSLSRLGSLSLDFANKCLRNAHYLERKILNLKKQKEEYQQQQPQSETPSTTIVKDEPIEPNDLFKNYHIGMMLSILSSQAYVALCTYNPIVSLVACKQILAIFQENPHYSHIGFLYRFKYYAHLYAAEACINLNIPDQAIQFLSIDFIDHQIREISKYDTTDFNNIFYYNLSIAYILQNDLGNAEKSIYQIQQNLEQQQFIILQQLNNNNNNNNINDNNNNSNNNNINNNDNNNQFTIQQQIINLQQQQINETFSKINLLKVYLELRKGNSDKALLLIKNERPIPQI